MFDHQVKPMVAIEVNILHFVCKFCIFFRGSCENDYDISFIAFGCNAKSFVVAWVVVFSPPPHLCFRNGLEKGFSKYITIDYPGNLWPRSNSFPWIYWQIFRWWSVYCYLRSVWPMTNATFKNIEGFWNSNMQYWIFFSSIDICLMFLKKSEGFIFPG